MRIKSRSRIALQLLGASLIPLASPAHAQEQPSAQEGDVGLADIIVTAEKRSENLQDVPSAITAIGAEALELQDITDVRDISALAPNVSVMPGTVNPAATVLAIRGIPTPADESLTLDAPIAVYVDGIYLARSAASTVFMSDIERVEVLRGPQGTLFGRNTTGGAVSFTMRRPDRDPGVLVEAGYGNYDSRRFQTRVNTGEFAGTLRMSLSYAHRDAEGYVDNLLQPDKDRDPGASNTDAFRIAAVIDIGDTGSFYYSFDYSDLRNNVPAFQTTIAGPTVAGFLANATTSSGCNLTIASARQDALCLDDDARVRNELYGHVARLENDFGAFTFRSTTGWRSWRNEQPNSDLDGFGAMTGPLFSNATLFNGLPAALITPIVGAGPAQIISRLPVPQGPVSLFQTSNTREQDQFSQEFEFVSNNDGAFNWVAGAFYFYEKSKEDNPQTAGFILDVANLFRTNPAFGPLGPLLANAVPPATRYRAVIAPSDLIYSTNSESMALYGQAAFRSGNGQGPFGATLGLRYTWDEKGIRQSAPFTNITRASFSEPTGHLTLDYRFSDDVNVYAKVARGYRSGGFNVRTLQDPFKPETLWSYEAGLKSEFWDRRIRFNVAAFYAKYSDQQISQPVTNPGGGGFGVLTVNSGKADYTGIELETAFAPVDGLLINGSFGYVDRTVKQFPLTLADGSVINIADDIVEPGYAPKYTASGSIQYEHEFAGGITALGRIGASYEGKRHFFQVPQTSPFVYDIPGNARTLFDAQLRIDNIPIAGDATAFIQFWGKNIFDKEYVTRGIDFGALGYAGVYYGQPATYGVDIGFRF